MADDEMSRADAASWLVRIANDLRCAGDMPLVQMNTNGVGPASMSLADELWLVAFCLVRPTPHGRPAVADVTDTEGLRLIAWSLEGGNMKMAEECRRAADEIERLRDELAAWQATVRAHDALAAERADEIERLRAALAIAAGMISTLPPYEDQHPEAVMEMLLEEARRG